MGLLSFSINNTILLFKSSLWGNNVGCGWQSTENIEICLSDSTGNVTKPFFFFLWHICSIGVWVAFNSGRANTENTFCQHYNWDIVQRHLSRLYNCTVKFFHVCRYPSGSGLALIKNVNFLGFCCRHQLNLLVAFFLKTLLILVFQLTEQLNTFLKHCFMGCPRRINVTASYGGE